MKKLFIIALAIAALCVLVAGTSFAEDAKKEEAKKPAMPAGQKVFTEAKCQMCHTAYAVGIGEPPAEDAKTDDAKEEASGPPDLSLTGVGKTAEWMSLFLQKEETLNDKKHMMAFKGSDEELSSLVDWLMTLKPAEKVAKKVAKVEKAADKVEKAAEKVEKAAEKVEKAEEKVEKASGCGHDHGSHDKDADEGHGEGHDEDHDKD